MRYLIYVRVSGDKQDVDTQVENGNRYVDSVAQARDTRLVFEEQAMSTRIRMSKRTQLQALLSQVGKGDTVVVAAFDRIARCPNELIQICWKIFEKGAQVFSIAQPNVNKDLIPIFGSVASMERTAISRRTKEKLHAKRMRGEMTGTAPYGFKLDEKRLNPKEDQRSSNKPFLLEPNQNEADIVDLVVQMRSADMSYRSIADELNNLGHRNRAGQPFACMTVQRIVQRSQVENTVPAAT